MIVPFDKNEKKKLNLLKKKKKQLALPSKGYHVIATVRSATAAPPSPTGAEALLAERGVEVVPGVDVTDGSCSSRIRDALCLGDGGSRGERRAASLVIYNAAVMAVEKDLCSTTTTTAGGGGFDEGASRRCYEANALGFLRAASAVVPSLVARAERLELDREEEQTPPPPPPPKLILISSKMASLGRLAEAPGGAMYGYRASKAAANAVALSLARDLVQRGVAVGLCHPGTVASDMYRDYHGGGGDERLVPSAGVASPEDAAEAVLKVVEEKVSLETTGTFYDERGGVLPY